MPENYHVAIKAFLNNQESILLCKDIAGEWDLLGGRIDTNEFDVDFDEILKRELKEELGDNLKYKNNGIACIFRHKRIEITAPGHPEIKILMMGFDLEYLGGEITLSDEHSEYRWIPMNETDKFLIGGQLEGFLKYKEYLSSDNKKIIY